MTPIASAARQYLPAADGVTIDPRRITGVSLGTVPGTWTADDVILYQLSLGAGVPPTDRAELEYVDEGCLKVLPTFATLSPFPLLLRLGDVPGLDVNFAALLHAGQDLEMHGVLPESATVRHSGRVAHVGDEGRGARVVVEAETADETGEILCVNRYTFFLPGVHVPGGETVHRPRISPPQRRPDVILESSTLPQQALLYRRCGDRNPLHSDPAVAHAFGFERPILHGLCTYGIVCRAVVDHLLAGDPGRVARFRAAFAGVLFPGESILTFVWQEPERIVVQALSKPRRTPIITDAEIVTRPSSRRRFVQ